MLEQHSTGFKSMRYPRSFFHLAGLVFAVVLASLVSFSWGEPHQHIERYFVLLAALWLALGLGSVAVGGSVSLRAIVGWGILFRVVAFFGAPLFEDDYWRYIFDGWVFSVRGSPYGVPPLEFFRDPSVPDFLQPVLSRINYPEFPTVYGPVLELGFLLNFLLSPGQLFGLKGLIAGADLVVLGVLAQRASRRGVLLYAWCPLILQESYFTAHPELLGAAPLFLAAVLAADRSRPALRGVLGAIAVAAKVTAAPVVAVILVQGGIRTVAVVALCTLGVYAPFVLHGAGSEFDVVRLFLTEWEFNAGPFRLFSELTSRTGAKLVCGALFGLTVLRAMYLHYRGRLGGIVRGDVLYGALFLLSPVVNPWYLTWMVPFVALRPTPWGIAALMVVPLSYLHGLFFGGGTLAPYQVAAWVPWVEYGVVIGLFGAAKLYRWYSGKNRGSGTRPAAAPTESARG